MSGRYPQALDLIRREFAERIWQAFWLNAVQGVEKPHSCCEPNFSIRAAVLAVSRSTYTSVAVGGR